MVRAARVGDLKLLLKIDQRLLADLQQAFLWAIQDR